jgi:hypothetical protein
VWEIGYLKEPLVVPSSLQPEKVVHFLIVGYGFVDEVVAF